MPVNTAGFDRRVVVCIHRYTGLPEGETQDFGRFGEHPVLIAADVSGP